MPNPEMLTYFLQKLYLPGKLRCAEGTDGQSLTSFSLANTDSKVNRAMPVKLQQG